MLAFSISDSSEFIDASAWEIMLSTEPSPDGICIALAPSELRPIWTSALSDGRHATAITPLATCSSISEIISENSERALDAFGDSATYSSSPSYPAINSSGMPRGAILCRAFTRSCSLAISDSASREMSMLARASSTFDFIEATSFFTSATDLGPSVFTALISDCNALALVSSWLVSAECSVEMDCPTPIPSSKFPYSSM